MNIDLNMASSSSNNNESAQYNYRDNFEQLCKIGEGGYASVYKVKDRLDEQVYAIKIIEINELGQGEKFRISNFDLVKTCLIDQGTRQEPISKILREPKVLAQLNGDKVIRY